MNRPNLRLCLALGLLSAVSLSPIPSGRIGAQELPWLPAGKVRLDFAPTFWAWDTRYGLGPGGEKQIEPLGMDLTGNPLGSEILPGLLPLEASLREAMKDPSYRVNLGVSQAYLEQSRLVFPFRLELGLTDWLTIGAMVPFVRPRMEMSFALDADSLTATDGASPWVSDANSVIEFLNQFRSVLQGAQDSHPGDPAVEDAQSYLDALSVAYGQGTFFPVAGSAPALRLQERFWEITGALNALGISGLPSTVPMGQGYMDEEEFQEFLGTPHMRAFPLEDWTTLWSLGDAEITANVRLLQGGFEPDSLGNFPTFRYQLGGGFLVRLGTGDQEDTSRFFDQDPGDGQMDLEGSVFGLFEVGNRFGAWGQLRYGVQQEGELYRRIASASQTLPEFARTAPVRRTPGNYLEFDVNPRIFLTPAMSFGARYRFWSKGEDSYALGAVNTEIQDPATLPPAELLNLETEQKLQEIGFSATYSSVEAHSRGEVGLPVLVRATFFKPISGSGGQTPKGGRFQVGLTIYKTLWGGGTSASQELPGMVPGGR